MFVSLAEIVRVVMDQVTYKLPNAYDRDANSLQTGIDFPEPSLTQQSGADDADINVIVRRFRLTGEMPPARSVPEYGDFTLVTDFQSAMQELRRSQEAFDALPAELRARFQNDPAELLLFVQEDGNYDEAIRLGLVPPRPPEPPPEPVVEPPAVE